jgi:hypothetical protein
MRNSDRYLRVILTIIAIELLWLGLKDVAPAVSAQAEPARVIIASVDGGFVPVALAGQTATAGRPPLRPIQVGVTGDVAVRSPIKVEIDRPLKVEADRPLKVESVPYTPGERPGE